MCKDVGIVSAGDNTYKQCNCQEVKKYQRDMERSGIAKGFRNKTFENYKAEQQMQKIIKQIAQQYVNKFNNKNSFLICGQVGAGKTHICIAISNALMKKGVAVLYMQYREAITKLKQIITDETAYNKQLDRYKKAQVLYIDDLFKGKITPSDINIMFELINYRYLNSNPIIVSCEPLHTGLVEFDEAVGTRIIEMCKSFTIPIQKDLSLNYRLYDHKH